MAEPTSAARRGDQQFVDPEVSRAKFDREIAEFRSLAADYGRRGWFLTDATFPTAMVVLAATKLVPPALVTGVLFEYTNYDVRPPSVRLVNPFTREPYKASQLPAWLHQAVPSNGAAGLPPELAAGQPLNLQPLMQAYAPDDVPFLCLAGVREYHDHPGHSGDSWELQRAAGAGRLVRLLEIIARYGSEAVVGYGVNLIPQITFNFGQPPV